MIYIGLDNGITNNGIGVVRSDGTASLHKLPVKNELSYTKEAKHINRIDYPAFRQLLIDIRGATDEPLLVGLERPMVNPLRFAATMSAIRALEATLIALEDLGIPYLYIDSKEWQKTMLPAGLKGVDALKAASLTVGKRLFPTLPLKKDADGILMAEHLRRKNNVTVSN